MEHRECQQWERCVVITLHVGKQKQKSVKREGKPTYMSRRKPEESEGIRQRAHKVTCRRDVAWMFEQWDGDEDGLLSKDELMPLERNEREACVSQFIDMCDDMVVDGNISVDEWCDCFSFADDLRHEPPCHKQKHSIDPHVKGVFLPRCDLEGYYLPEQCHNGSCWCVDRFGREFDNSRTKAELPDCGQYANELDIEDKTDLLHRI
ncbi:hypothetical protein KIN20_008585 [Parelaphostrongylus tenuis]|uniref:Thyroglobulin type-1 domain-containing protein n=1 Tax=Parelaphostrongylus tenuis TaxID=148309 RepID=A0AAD5QKP7_PARTN|nr:hypothetical protein KIN20_008585 [Parelaphostrongylus tenuis]